MNIKVHLLGALVDYLPDSARGQTVLSLEDKRIEVLQIGPAGEKMVRSAALISMSNRANGRTGMGAVMGSKNLKAIVVRGKQKPSVANPDAFKILQKLGPKTMKPTGMDEFGKYGTPGVCSPQHHSGGLPTYNFNSGAFDHHEDIDGIKLSDERPRGHRTRVRHVAEENVRPAAQGRAFRRTRTRQGRVGCCAR